MKQHQTRELCVVHPGFGSGPTFLRVFETSNLGARADADWPAPVPLVSGRGADDRRRTRAASRLGEALHALVRPQLWRRSSKTSAAA